MQEKPRALLRDAEPAGYLIGAEAVPGVGDKPYCRKPLVQADGGVLHERAGLDAELLLAVPALPYAAGREAVDVLAPALRAGHAVGPAQRGQEVHAVVRV